MPEPALKCLLHADIHPLTDDCRAVLVTYNRAHPQPFTTASRRDYLAAVDRAMAAAERTLLDDHIREHHRDCAQPVPATRTPAAPASTDHLERAA
ncbi:hypothetical protein [Kitasatospora cineracea]|uniref:Uncharacterized protein n=1 Tax=Kitasatospora cineracea TaxID=88074 RepID=A0A3N4RG33_9ACTN|nr:hypothetical protein [Kitasatospora cineracea]RPE27225.1 hypothetical protein EDD38_7369 [Kitasatospora cineracea]RPE27357.1 hypothetical protein EDD38_7502 [Kitasatospora cineracea]